MNMKNRKVPLQVFSLTLICCTLCACQTKNTKDTEQEQSSLPEHNIEIQAYLPVVANNDAEDVMFSLIFLDNDTIPELVAFDQYGDKYSVYTIKNGSAVCLVDSITTVEMSYFEKKNILSAFFRWNGGGNEGGYANRYYQMGQYSETLTGDFIPSFELVYHAVYDTNGEWAGEGITEYYENGKKIDETAYHQIFDDFNILQDDGVSCFSERTQHFTKDEMITYIQ